MGRGGATPAQPARLLPGSCRSQQFHRTASAAGAVAVATDADNPDAPRGTFEIGSTACRPLVRRKTKGISPAHRRTLVGTQLPRPLTLVKIKMAARNGGHLKSIIVLRRSNVLGRPGSDLLFQALRLSTIGAGKFNGRVRDGIEFSLSAKTTRPAKNV